MKTSQLTLAVLLTAAFSSAYSVEVKGGDSSKGQLIQAAESDSLPFGAGAAGIKVSTGNGLSNSINLQAGPAQRIRNKYGNAPINGGNQNANVNGTANPKYLQPGDINPIAGWFSKTKLAQVWYEKTRQQHRSVQRTPNGRPQITDCAEIRWHDLCQSANCGNQRLLRRMGTAQGK